MDLEYFMGANISWAPTFYGRLHFMGAYILCVIIIVGGRQYLMIFAVSSASFILQ